VSESLVNDRAGVSGGPSALGLRWLLEGCASSHGGGAERLLARAPLAVDQSVVRACLRVALGAAHRWQR
jgi:hypothetical protein